MASTKREEIRRTIRALDAQDSTSDAIDLYFLKALPRAASRPAGERATSYGSLKFVLIVATRPIELRALGEPREALTVGAPLTTRWY